MPQWKAATTTLDHGSNIIKHGCQHLRKGDSVGFWDQDAAPSEGMAWVDAGGASPGQHPEFSQPRGALITLSFQNFQVQPFGGLDLPRLKLQQRPHMEQAQHKAEGFPEEDAGTRKAWFAGGPSRGCNSVSRKTTKQKHATEVSKTVMTLCILAISSCFQQFMDNGQASVLTDQSLDS